MTNDRRRTSRIDVDGELSGQITVVEPMRVAQISPSGAQIDTTSCLHVGTVHDIRLALDTTSVVVKGRIVHASVRHVFRDQVFYRAGIEFVDLTDAAARSIADFVNRLVSQNDPDRGGDHAETDTDA